ncbi:lytic transglycosylase domain-containing protein [Hymenobacter pini]|uniref:lytic transglycosylase domain-containing protein n=1 Tax=Hymenobacter pini TaxID=2880879 RepID=UPI001CF2534E|nr:lytic transglycosylase domain-containing protein [Hymenobacter pini]MCA8831874.1 LysM peptidoglycan-binding domain-containing protein [Hymenobacter pini]
MKKSLLRAAVPVLLASALARPVAAQVRPQLPPAPQPALNDTLQVHLELLPDSLVAVPVPVDSARLRWLRTPPELRDLVGDRIACIETEMPHAFNNHVMAFVRLFTERQRGYTQRVLERENLYFPLFEKYLAKYNLPTDLKYLAVVESALIPTAKSRVGATGLWQFMGPTANDLRLRRDEWVDERMDPEKATEAACKHLRYLYGVFHDWEMVLAAYNWGAGNMQKVVRRTGKKTYWEVHPNLPVETRNYVPTFTAIMYAMKYANEHQLHSPALRYQHAEAMDTLQLGGRPFDLTRLARACGYPDSMALLRLNPELRKPYLPAGYRPYTVQFPASTRITLAAVDRETLFDYCRPLAELPTPLPLRSVLLTGVEPFPTQDNAVAATRPAAAQPKYRRVRHTVKRGETVASVAEQYAVSTAQLRRWNELGRGNSLTSRKQLVVFVPQAAPAIQAASATMVAVAATKPVAVRPPKAASAPEPKKAEDIVEVPVAARAARSVAARPAARRTLPVEAAPSPAEVDDTVPTYYVVRSGDFLEKVARTHNLTIAQLKAWNNLKGETVQPGQKLMLVAPTPTAELVAATREVATQRPAARPAPATPKTNQPLPEVHLVQPGDTLYNISRRYQGLTVEKLRELNHLQSDDVKPGQKLIVRS